MRDFINKVTGSVLTLCGVSIAHDLWVVAVLLFLLGLVLWVVLDD